MEGGHCHGRERAAWVVKMREETERASVGRLAMEAILAEGRPLLPHPYEHDGG